MRFNIPYHLLVFSHEQASMDSEVTDKDYWFSKFITLVRTSEPLRYLTDLKASL